MKKLFFKVNVMITIYIICNYVSYYKFYNASINARSHLSYILKEILIILIFQVFVYLLYRIKPLENKKEKIKYWIWSAIFSIITLFIWGHLVISYYNLYIK